ncbi:MAG: hypothetical protein E7585_00455 [Ruminococcaceae bacterium]|nr:hypothetical protein [Oscillospiraceae bacterium]
MNKKNKLAVRIIAWILAILMVLSLGILSVQLIVDQIRLNKEAKEKEQQEQQENGDHDHDHDHDHDE